MNLEILRFVVYPSNCHVINILCDVRGGVHWRGTRAPTPAVDSRCLSYCHYPGVPPPQPTGRGSNTRSLERPRPPMVENHWHTPITRSHLPQLRDTKPASSGVLRVYILKKTLKTSIYLLSGSPSAALFPLSRQRSGCGDTQ